MINHCRGKRQTRVTENASKQQNWMLTLRESLQVTSLPHSEVIKTLVQRESQRWVSRHCNVDFEDSGTNVVAKLLSVNDDARPPGAHK